MRKHIIVEGMDGSGKDTLIAQLLDLTDGEFEVHERASTSLGGPVDNLAEWVIRDLSEMPTNPPMIYNRHPLISEPIYAPRRMPSRGLTGMWRNDTWIDVHRMIASQHCITIICQPTWATVYANLIRSGSESHMPGVFENARDLYRDYASLVWPGSIRYNYLRESPRALLRTIRTQLIGKAS